jgi:hypothetical protein
MSDFPGSEIREEGHASYFSSDEPKRKRAKGTLSPTQVAWIAREPLGGILSFDCERHLRA